MVNRTTSFNCRLPILSWIVTSIQLPPETIRTFPINQPIHLIPYTRFPAWPEFPVSIDESRSAFNSTPFPFFLSFSFFCNPFLVGILVFTGNQPEPFLYSDFSVSVICIDDFVFPMWFQFLLY